MSAIQRIVALQKIDSQLQDIAELLGDLPRKVDALKNECQGLENGTAHQKGII